MSIINELANKRVLILGLGREGESTFTFLRRRLPYKIIGVADKLPLTQLGGGMKQLVESDEKVTSFLGDGYLGSVAQYDLIFKAPGVSPFLPELVAARKAGGKIISNTDLFFECCPGRIIGVTGTKGKSTTTSLIYEVLKRGGIDVRLTGNIGAPSLSSLDGATPTTVFVTELSSYQLMDLRKSPQIAVLQDVVQEHLDYHRTFEAYVKAKENIALYQSADDYLIFNASYPIPSRIASKSKARKIPFGFRKIGDTGCFLEGDLISYYSDGKREMVLSIEAVPLKGNFNLQNVMPAIVIGMLFGVSPETIAIAIRDFRALEHRLEFVRTHNGISFYNDSLATVPEATIAAIQAFGKEGIILLGGGFDRGQDFTELARTIMASNVRGVILFPATGKRFWERIVLEAGGRGNLPEHLFVTDMEDGIQRAWELAEEGDVVLLSPASASFGCFKDYRDRGDRFKAAVMSLCDTLKP